MPQAGVFPAWFAAQAEKLNVTIVGGKAAGIVAFISAGNERKMEKAFPCQLKLRTNIRFCY